MNNTRCPHCDAVLDRVDLASGWCDNCGKKIPGFARSTGISPTRPEAPRSTEPEPSSQPRRPVYREPNHALRLLIALALVIVIAAGVGLYFWLRSDVEITVDNGAPEPVTVYLDGSEKLTVPAGDKKVLACRSGQRQITVKRGERTVFDERRQLEGGGKRGPRKYLLNPEGDNRYWLRTVHYGTQIPGFSLYHDDADRYRQAAGEIKLIRVSAWVDEDPDLILQEPPASVQGNFSDTRTVVSRIKRADYDLIAAADKKETVSSDDVVAMEALVKRLQDSGQ
jgi:hypothetical protein